MKNLRLLVCLIIITFIPISGQDLYDINTITEIEITFAETNWDYLLDSYVSAGNEERLMGSVSINGMIFDSVGVRYKGNSSYRATQVKNPLNIKLDHIIDDQEYQDYGTLKLANVYKDPSFIREALGYEIARQYFPASQANYARVSINGTYLGLYTSVQDVDKHFARSHAYDDDATRIKGEITGNAHPGSMGGVWQYFGTDSSDYFAKYAMESDVGWTDLVDFLDTLNNHTSEVEKVLNIDRHLWFLAFQNLLVNLDGPINNPQNYYLFKDELGRFNTIPWDLNECFGVFATLQTSGQLGTYQMQRLSPFVNMNESDYPVISKVLTNDTYKKMYVAHMKTMLEDVILSGWYSQRAFELQDIIASEVAADPNKFYTYANFLANINGSVSSGGPPPGQSIVGVAQLMDTRGSYLSTLTEFLAQAPEITQSSTNPIQVSADSTLNIFVEAEYASSVFLLYRETVSEPFHTLEMQDDGLHADGASGDGIFGSGDLQVNSDLQYYFYAENDAAISFLPEHASNDLYLVSVVGDIVINEFLAINDLSNADQDGEFDDWVELFNNTSSDIPLAGYFLSDDGTDLTQWSFPDTVIPANGFLTIWADNDEEQEGLHANFKLSASGETLYMLNPDTMIINEITFGEQVADSSWGRNPDGMGSFERMLPSFNGTNNPLTSTVSEPRVLPNGFILSPNFPNPFNPRTTLRYHLTESSDVSLVIYDVQGREVRSFEVSHEAPGWQKIVWDGLSNTGLPVSTGIYLAQLQAGNEVGVVKMTYLK